jgi:hypothetical protein
MVVYSTSFSGFSKNKPGVDYFNLARGDYINECNRAVTIFGIMASASNSNATTTTLSGLLNHGSNHVFEHYTTFIAGIKSSYTSFLLLKLYSPFLIQLQEH